MAPSYSGLFDPAKKVLTLMKVIFLLSLSLTIVFSGSMKYILIFIRSLQLIVHLPLFNSVFPANALIVTKILFPFAMFDLEIFGIN